MASRAPRSATAGTHFSVGRLRHVAVVDTGCGCRPRRPRLLGLPAFLRPSPKPPRSSPISYSFASSSTTTSLSSSSATNTTYSYSSSAYSAHCTAKQEVPVTAPSAAKKTKKRQDKEEEEDDDDVGVAVVKDSSDPYADFRESMVQMVVEMGLCEWDDLRGMLRRLLALNSPRHHHAILSAFAEVWAQIAAPPPPPPPPPYHRR